jgi:hypothetical protein
MWTAFVSLVDPKAGGGGATVSAPEDKAQAAAAAAATSVGNHVENYDENGSSTFPSNDSTMEVDYVKNPTPLYKKVQKEDWTAVANFLDAGYCTCG